MAENDLYEGYIEYITEKTSCRLTIALMEQATTTDSSNAKLLAEAVVPHLQTVLADALTTQATLGCVYLRQTSPAFSIPGLAPFEGVDGNSIIAPCPAIQTYVLNMANAIGGTNANGMWQFSGINIVSTIDSKLDPAWIAAEGAAIVTKLLATVTTPPGDDFKFGVVSRFLDGLPRVPPVFGVITSATWNGFPRTRRTRRTELTGAPS